MKTEVLVPYYIELLLSLHSEDAPLFYLQPFSHYLSSAFGTDTLRKRYFW